MPPEVSEGASVTITSPPTGWPQRATPFILTASPMEVALYRTAHRHASHSPPNPIRITPLDSAAITGAALTWSRPCVAARNGHGGTGRSRGGRRREPRHRISPSSLDVALAAQRGTGSRERSGDSGPHVHGPPPKIPLALERTVQRRRIRGPRDRRHRLRHVRRRGHELHGGGRQRVLVRRHDLLEFWA